MTSAPERALSVLSEASSDSGAWSTLSSLLQLHHVVKVRQRSLRLPIRFRLSRVKHHVSNPEDDPQNNQPNHFLTEFYMTDFIDLDDEEEPSTISEAYLARLAEYRRRLTLLRDNLFRLNGILEDSEVAREPVTATRH